MKAHEFLPADVKGRQWCKRHHPAATSTCLERSEAAPELGRRESALDDIDALAARLAELRAERDAMLTWPEAEAEAPDMAFDDCCHD